MGSQTRSSTVAWSSPSTPEQQAYYSRHAKKRATYGWVQSGLHVLHSVISFGAWYMLVEAGIGRYYYSPILFAGLSVAALLILHPLLATTWQTFFYDKFDNDSRTDSSIWIPVAIAALLLFTEYQGAQRLLVARVQPPATTAPTAYDADEAGSVRTVEDAKKSALADAAGVYEAKRQAIVATANAQVAKAQRRKAGWKQVAAIHADRDVKLATLKTEEATARQGIVDKHTKAADDHRARFTTLRSDADTKTRAAQQQYENELAATGSYAWIISLGVLGLILGLGYARVRINVRSGILPVYNFTELDAHGGAAQRIGVALRDALNRQTMRLAVWLHRTLSPNKAIEDFDGTVIVVPSSYNSAAQPASAKGGLQVLASNTTPASEPSQTTPPSTRPPDYEPFKLPVRRNSMYSGAGSHQRPAQEGQQISPQMRVSSNGRPATYSEGSQSVSQPVTPVTQQTDAAPNDTDAAMRNYKTEIMRDVANLRNENGVRLTIMLRLLKSAKALNQLTVAPGFAPSDPVRTDVQTLVHGLYTEWDVRTNQPPMPEQYEEGEERQTFQALQSTLWFIVQHLNPGQQWDVSNES